MNPNLKKDLSLVGLLRLIEICCGFEEELDKLRVKLIQSPSFDFVSSYLAITVAHGEINMINFVSFMKSHDKRILPLEIEYFFRRVDLNNDGIIDLKEWYNFLCPLAYFWIADKNSYTPFSDDLPYLVAKDEKLVFHICKRFIDYQLVLDTPRKQLLNDPDFVVKELFVWIVDKTKCPVIAAFTAICAVSSSLISPIITTSGSCLKILLNALGNVIPALAFTFT